MSSPHVEWVSPADLRPGDQCIGYTVVTSPRPVSGEHLVMALVRYIDGAEAPRHWKIKDRVTVLSRRPLPT